MSKKLPIEFIYQLFSLIIAIILVHAIYVSIVRPNAALALEDQAIQLNANPDYVPERSAYVVIRDFEQEACLILMLWAMSLMGYKAVQTAREKSVMQLDLIPLNQGTSILPEDTREYSRPIQALPEDIFYRAPCSLRCIDSGLPETFRMSRMRCGLSAIPNPSASIQSFQ